MSIITRDTLIICQVKCVSKSLAFALSPNPFPIWQNVHFAHRQPMWPVWNYAPHNVFIFSFIALFGVHSLYSCSEYGQHTFSTDYSLSQRSHRGGHRLAGDSVHGALLLLGLALCLSLFLTLFLCWDLVADSTTSVMV